MTDQIRKEFEQWASTQYGDALDLTHDGLLYADSFALALFVGWQAAHDRYTQQQAQPVQSVPQDLKEKTYFHKSKSFGVEAIVEVIRVADLREWMAGHARVPVELSDDIIERVCDVRNMYRVDLTLAWDETLKAIAADSQEKKEATNG